MNTARLAELHLKRAALARQLAVVDENIAAELAGGNEEAPVKPKPPAYRAPDNVSEISVRKAERVLVARGRVVRGRSQ